MGTTELIRARPSGSIVGLPSVHPRRTYAQAPTARPSRQEDLIVIRCGGQTFLARPRLATIFLRRALDVLAGGDFGMVPLLHSTGLELLLITPATAVACVYDGQTLADIKSHWDAQLSGILDTETRAR